MSVVHFENRELEALWGAIDPKDTDVARTIYSLAVANRAAYLCSYPDTKTMDAPSIQAPIVGDLPAWVRTVEAWVASFLYNCVSNGGSDFADNAKAEQLLVAARRADEKRRAA